MKPILFNTDMVRAILEGRKTVTRRAVKPQSPGETHPQCFARMPYCTDDILYVRETWNYGFCDTTDFEFQVNETFFEELTPGTQKDSFLFPRYFYRTEDLDGIVGMKWRPSIPHEAARIFLRVMDVRVERLQEITITELQDEGILPDGYISRYSVCTTHAFDKFKELWDRTIKSVDRALYGWEANPYVWVISFERCERPEEG